MSSALFYITCCFFILGTYCVIDWSPVDNVIQEGINTGIFSGCVLGVANINSTILKKAYGTTIPKRGFYAPPMQVNYKFDINRLTQVIGTNSALMELYDIGSINITKRISAVLTDFNNNGKTYLTLDNMLLHNSGFPSEYTTAFPSTPALLLKNIEGSKLDYTL
jgi:CubicO group peptidase (beta-lactamase class C family)